MTIPNKRPPPTNSCDSRELCQNDLNCPVHREEKRKEKEKREKSKDADLSQINGFNLLRGYK